MKKPSRIEGNRLVFEDGHTITIRNNYPNETIIILDVLFGCPHKAGWRHFKTSIKKFTDIQLGEELPVNEQLGLYCCGDYYHVTMLTAEMMEEHECSTKPTST